MTEITLTEEQARMVMKVKQFRELEQAAKDLGIHDIFSLISDMRLPRAIEIVRSAGYTVSKH